MEYKRVLCVCSANVCRSPTMAKVFASDPYNYDTRSCGTDKFYALIPVSKNLIEWAQEIICAEEHHAEYIRKHYPEWKVTETIKILGIQDLYDYHDKGLIEMIRRKYNRLAGN